MDPSTGPTSTAPRQSQRPPGWSGPPPADLGSTGSPSAWLLVWTIVVLKLITLVVTVAVARSWDAGAIVALTSWLWVLVVAVLVAGPLLFRLRLRRVRARRAELLRGEWLVDEPDGR
jgi:hypothetical protein